MWFRMPPFPTLTEFRENPERCRHIMISGYRRMLWHNRSFAVAGIVMVTVLIMVLSMEPTTGWDFGDLCAIFSIVMFIRAGVNVVKVERSILSALYSLEDSDWSSLQGDAERYFASRDK